MHQVDCSAHSDSQICCLGWGVSFGDDPTLRAHTEKPGGVLNLDDLSDPEVRVKQSQTLTNLPRDLAFLDVEGVLPTLSPLSSGGKQ